MNKFLKSQNYFREFGAIATDWELRNLTVIIYKITNLVDGKSYIGQTYRTFINRYASLEWWKWTSNYLLKEAAQKDGKENFKIEIFDYNIQTLEELNKLETMYIALFNTLAPGGYNLTMGGTSYIVSQWVKEQMSFIKSKTHILIDKTGKEYVIPNLRLFCIEKGLSYKAMAKMACDPKRGNISSQGFALKGTDLKLIKNLRRTKDDMSKRVYYLQNKQTKEIKSFKTKHEIRLFIQISRSSVDNLLKVKDKVIKNWSFLHCEAKV